MQKNNYSVEFANMFDNCLNILRDTATLTGINALRPLLQLISFKQLESSFGKQIDIDNFEYDFSDCIGNVEGFKKKLLKSVRFSNLVKKKRMTYQR